MSAKVCDGQQWRTWRKTWPRAKRLAARWRRRAEEESVAEFELIGPVPVVHDPKDPMEERPVAIQHALVSLAKGSPYRG